MKTPIFIYNLKPETIAKHVRFQGNRQDKAIDTLLEQNDIKYSVVYCGESTDDKWQADNWLVTFQGQKTCVNFDYRAGIRHRYFVKASSWGMPQDAGGKKRFIEENSQPVSPFAASVLYCLLYDATACDMSFDDWCDNYGYDTDSRKALETYLACQSTGNKLRIIFSSKLIAEISAILEGY